MGRKDFNFVTIVAAIHLLSCANGWASNNDPREGTEPESKKNSVVIPHEDIDTDSTKILDKAIKSQNNKEALCEIHNQYEKFANKTKAELAKYNLDVGQKLFEYYMNQNLARIKELIKIASEPVKPDSPKINTRLRMVSFGGKIDEYSSCSQYRFRLIEVKS